MLVYALRNHPVLSYIPERYTVYVAEAFAAPYDTIHGRLRRTMPNGMTACPLGAALAGPLLARQQAQGRRLSLQPDATMLCQTLVSVLEEERGSPITARVQRDIFNLVCAFNREVDTYGR